MRHPVRSTAKFPRASQHGRTGLAKLSALVGLTLLVNACSAPDPPAVQLRDYGPTAAFNLVDQEGQPFSSEQLRGRIALLFFGYASCPDICPTTLSRLQAATSSFAEDRPRIVLITVDPTLDTPDRLKTYLDHFDAPILGLTGSTEALQAVAKAYGVFSELQSEPEAPVRNIAHTSSVFLVDREGVLRALLSQELTAAEIADAIERLQNS